MRPAAPMVLAQVAATAATSLLAIRLAGGAASVLALQAGAFALTAALLAAGAARRHPVPLAERIPAPWLIGLVLLAVAAMLAFGGETGGARRWLRLGPLVLQPAILLGSILLLALARTQAGWASTLLAGMAILLVGLGNDGAASLAFALGISGLLAGGQARRAQLLPLCLLAWGMAIWGWTRPDSLPSVPYVEEVITRAAGVSAVAGAAAALALGLLPLPFLLASRAPCTRAAGLGLAGFWSGLALAGVLGNYPIPVIGFGASYVLGWVLALGLVTRHAGAAQARSGVSRRSRPP